MSCPLRGGTCDPECLLYVEYEIKKGGDIESFGVCLYFKYLETEIVKNTCVSEYLPSIYHALRELKQEDNTDTAEEDDDEDEEDEEGGIEPHDPNISLPTPITTTKKKNKKDFLIAYG